MHTFGILDTGAPKTFRYIHAAIKKGAVPRSRIGLLLCDNPKTPVLDAAAELGVPHAYLPGKKESRDRWARDAFLKAGVDDFTYRLPAQGWRPAARGLSGADF